MTYLLEGLVRWKNSHPDLGAWIRAAEQTLQSKLRHLRGAITMRRPDFRSLLVHSTVFPRCRKSRGTKQVDAQRATRSGHDVALRFEYPGSLGSLGGLGPTQRGNSRNPRASEGPRIHRVTAAQSPSFLTPGSTPASFKLKSGTFEVALSLLTAVISGRELAKLIAWHCYTAEIVTLLSTACVQTWPRQSSKMRETFSAKIWLWLLSK